MGTILGVLLRHGLSFYAGIAAFFGSDLSSTDAAINSFMDGLSEGNMLQVSAAVAALLSVVLSMWNKKKLKREKKERKQKEKDSERVDSETGGRQGRKKRRGLRRRGGRVHR